MIAIDSDLLFDEKEVRTLAENIPNARFELVHSDYGHDGFLIETNSITQHLQHFLKKD